MICFCVFYDGPTVSDVPQSVVQLPCITWIFTTSHENIPHNFILIGFIDIQSFKKKNDNGLRHVIALLIVILLSH